VATSPSRLRRWTEAGRAIDAEIVAAAALLSAVLVVGLATAADYGLTVDEFNSDDYGPKALAWYTSGFVDRSHFETVEFSLWYYGPWFRCSRPRPALRHLLVRPFGTSAAPGLCALAG
jgi:hypothetical protein